MNTPNDTTQSELTTHWRLEQRRSAFTAYLGWTATFVDLGDLSRGRARPGDSPGRWPLNRENTSQQFSPILVTTRRLTACTRPDLGCTLSAPQPSDDAWWRLSLMILHAGTGWHLVGAARPCGSPELGRRDATVPTTALRHQAPCAMPSRDPRPALRTGCAILPLGKGVGNMSFKFFLSLNSRAVIIRQRHPWVTRETKIWSTREGP